MRRRISLLLAAMLTATTLVLFGPTPPAGAIVFCGAQGTMTVAPGLLYPILGGITGGPMKDHVVDVLIGEFNIVHGFNINLNIGAACVHVAVPPTISPALGAGTLKGYCGYSSGTGTFKGRPFAYVGVGTLLILTGHVTGLASAFPVPGTGSCAHFEPVTPLPSGAFEFLVTGAVVGTNCSNPLPGTDTLFRVIDSDTLVIEPLTGISLLGVHVHLGIHFYTTPICINPSPTL